MTPVATEPLSIPDDVMEFAPWSYSKANQGNTCGFAFKMQHVKREPRAEPENRVTTIGTVVHYMAEVVSRGATVSNAMRCGFEKYPDLTRDITLKVKTFRGALDDFAKNMARYHQKFHIEERWVEKKLGLTKNLTPTGFFDKDVFLRGKADFILVTRHPRVGVILDHKSGAVMDMSIYAKQLQMYMVFLDAHLPNIPSFQGVVNFLDADPDANGKRTKWTDIYTVEDVRVQFRNELIKFLTSAVAAGKVGDPNVSWLCDYCGYRPLCPKHKR